VFPLKARAVALVLFGLIVLVALALPFAPGEALPPRNV
jgi:hypothetical protein